MLKNELILIFNEFYERGIINKSMNPTFIILIPKKDGIISPKDYRPISLIGSVYKIITKVLSKRIREVMGGITSMSHGAFGKDKQIQDEILIANKCVKKMKVIKNERNCLQSGLGKDI